MKFLNLIADSQYSSNYDWRPRLKNGEREIPLERQRSIAIDKRDNFLQWKWGRSQDVPTSHKQKELVRPTQAWVHSFIIHWIPSLCIARMPSQRLCGTSNLWHQYVVQLKDKYSNSQKNKCHIQTHPFSRMTLHERTLFFKSGRLNYLEKLQLNPFCENRHLHIRNAFCKNIIARR